MGGMTITEAWQALYRTYEHLYHSERPPSAGHQNVLRAAEDQVIAIALREQQPIDDGPTTDEWMAIVREREATIERLREALNAVCAHCNQGEEGHSRLHRFRPWADVAATYAERVERLRASIVELLEIAPPPTEGVLGSFIGPIRERARAALGEEG